MFTFINLTDTERLSPVGNFITALESTSPKGAVEATTSTSSVRQIVCTDYETEEDLFVSDNVVEFEQLRVK